MHDRPTPRPRGERLSGWCESARLVTEEGHTCKEPVERLHGRCAGAWAGKEKTVRCTCSCHSGEEAPVTHATRLETVVTAVAPGKRSSKLLVELAERLRVDGELEFPAPEDEKENKSLRERIYSAARRSGMKVKVTNKDGLIRAVRK
jgi:hypothetical protein